MQAHHLDVGNVLDQRRIGRRFRELEPHLFEQLPSLVGLERHDQGLFGCGQHALEANDDEVGNEEGVNIFGGRPMYSCSKRRMP